MTANKAAPNKIKNILQPNISIFLVIFPLFLLISSHPTAATVDGCRDWIPVPLYHRNGACKQPLGRSPFRNRFACVSASSADRSPALRRLLKGETDSRRPAEVHLAVSYCFRTSILSLRSVQTHYDSVAQLFHSRNAARGSFSGVFLSYARDSTVEIDGTVDH